MCYLMLTGFSLAISSGSTLSSWRATSLSLLRAAHRDAESMTPRAIDVANTEVPPLEMSGNGCPDTGNTPTTMHMWKRACKQMTKAQPKTSRHGRVCLNSIASRPARPIKNMYSNSTPMAIITPNSSTIMAYM